MKESIETEIRNFNESEYQIESVLFDISLEQDTTNQDTTIDDAEKKENFGNKLKARVDHIIQEIIAIVNRLFNKLAGIAKKMAVTDKGFQKEARQAMVKNKPLEAVKLIAYQYNDTFMQNQKSKMTNLILNLIKNLKTSYADEKDTENNQNPLDMDKSGLYEYIFKEMGCPDGCTDINLYYEHMKNNFRGKKKEQLFKASVSSQYYNIAMSYSKISNDIDSRKLVLKQQISTLRTNLSNITKNPASQDSVKKRALKQAANASHLFNIYSTFLSFYSELYIEKTMSYRLVLKKLFHF